MPYNHSLQQPTLSKESPAYRANRDDINQLIQWAQQTSVERLLRNFVHRNEIICVRGEGDKTPSVASVYFGFAKNLPVEFRSDDSGSLLREDNLRELVEGVLAMRLTILEYVSESHDSTTSPYEIYRQLIAELEDFCAQNGIPSLLPNLFLPASLAARLKDEGYYVRPENQTVMKELFQKLAVLFARHDHHLHVLVHNLFKRKKYEEVLCIISDAASTRAVENIEVLQSNSAMAETYIRCLFELQRYAEVVDCCRQLGDEIVGQKHIMLQKYLQSLLETSQTEEVQRILVQQYAVISENTSNPFMKQTLIDVCVAVGYMLNGQGEPEHAIDFINQYCPPDLQEHKDVVNLLKQLSQ